MAEVTIRTNKAWRPILHAGELTTKEAAEFDYYDNVDDFSQASFFRYKGQVYDLANFMKLRESDPGMPFKGWHGYSGDSYFSGIVIELSKCGEMVRVGRYYS